MLQTFLNGAYKSPRKVMWMVDVVLFLIVMAFAFTGYLLRWDQTAYWATQVGLNMVGTVPQVGEFLMKVMRGGAVLGRSDCPGSLPSMCRFFSWSLHCWASRSSPSMPCRAWIRLSQGGAQH